MGGGGGGGGSIGKAVQGAGSGGSMGAILGGTGLGNNKTVKKYGGTFDPLDVFGTKQSNRDDQTAKMIAEQEAQVKAHMDKRPKYKSVVTKKGVLNKKAAVKAPTKAKAVQVDVKALDKKLALAKNANVKDVKYTGDVKSGQNFQDAQGNINTLQQRAFGTDTSPWAQKLYDQQALQESGQLDALGHEQALAQNQQLNALAMQGGLEGGSRERLAKASQRDQMMGRQGVFRQGQTDKLAIGINDEAQRMELQQQMPGMNLQMDQYQTGLASQNRDVRNQLSLANQGKNMTQQQFNSGLAMDKANSWSGVMDANAGRTTGANQFNAGQQNQVNAINQATLVGDIRGKNAYDLEGWTTAGTMMGNQQAANAQANQGKGSGGFLSKLGLGG